MQKCRPATEPSRLAVLDSAGSLRQKGGMSEFVRPQKHSLTLNGHQTSVSLEPIFWRGFRHIAHVRNMSINELAAEIDTQRAFHCSLASAIRIMVLQYWQDQSRADSRR